MVRLEDRKPIAEISSCLDLQQFANVVRRG